MIIGVDTGGTFTDLVVIRGNETRVHKVASTPDDPAEAVLRGLRELLSRDPESVTLTDLSVIHGSTVATNALLERRGARVALVTTAGFEDVIEIGRQARREIYDLAVTKPEPLVPRERRFGVSERLDEQGGVLTALIADQGGPGSVADTVESVAESGAEAVAICLLHSYANPDHESTLAEALRSVAAQPVPFVTASHEVLPEFREYERTSTTVVNAFVGPVMSRYLGSLARRLPDGRQLTGESTSSPESEDPTTPSRGVPVRVMTSNGGVASLDVASRLAVQTILSGPAGGAVGGFEIGRRAGYDHVITFDMGGTSTDVSLCPGSLSRRSEAEIGGLPIRVPVIDIHTVGAGGGSIARRDPGGSLRVGPESAGADPGPICYGSGGDAITVTDANLFLGRLSPHHFLGGAVRLEPEPVEPAIADLAAELAISPTEVAEGVLRVANATMERAIRVISLERGYDPRDFSLVCFGGAGGLHAADLAGALGIPRVIVPPDAGTLSALGMLMAEPTRDFSKTLLVPTAGVERRTLESEFAALERSGFDELVADGVPEASLRFERLADLRYVGQGYELEVPAGDDLSEAFHRAHDRRYGYADRDRPTEIVTIRSRITAEVGQLGLTPGVAGSPDASGAIMGERTIVYEGLSQAARLVDREALRPGHELVGPCIVTEYSTTTLVPPAWQCRVDMWNNLILKGEANG